VHAAARVGGGVLSCVLAPRRAAALESCEVSPETGSCFVLGLVRVGSRGSVRSHAELGLRRRKD